MADYTITLGKLRDASFLNNGRAPNDSSLPPTPRREIEDVPSEDDGPTDFTLDMEKWMRGSEAHAKTGSEACADEDSGAKPIPPKSTAEDYEDESEFLPCGTSTPPYHIRARLRTEDSVTRAKLDQGPIEAEDRANARIAELEGELKTAKTEADNKIQSLEKRLGCSKRTIDDLKKEKEDATSEITSLKTQLETSKTDSATTLQNHLEASKHSHDEELKKASAQAAAAKEASDAQHQHTTTQLHDTIAALKIQLTTTTTALSTQASDHEAALAAALATQSSDHEAALAAALATQASDNEAINTALSARLMHALEKREKEWRRRVKLLLNDHDKLVTALEALAKERDGLVKDRDGLVKEKETLVAEREKMARVVMALWGREEVGPAKLAEGERQGYRYRYVKR